MRCSEVDPSSSSDGCRVEEELVPIDTPRVCHLQLPTLARADLSIHVLLDKSAHSLFEKGSLTWESNSSSSMRRDHKHLMRRHCGVEVTARGSVEEVVEKSHDDFDCVL